MYTIKRLFPLLAAVLLAACGGNTAQETHEEHDHSLHATESEEHHEAHADEAEEHAEAHEHEEGIIELTPEKAQEAGITAAPAQTAPFANVIPALGEILPMQGDIVTVTAKNEGFIRFGGRDIVSGTAVSAGAGILTVTTQGMTQNNYSETVAQAEIAFGNARDLYERNRSLYEDKLVTATELEASEAAYKAAQLRLNNLRQGYEREGLRVASPISGYVTDINVQEGDFVQLGQPLFTVAKNRNVMLRADVPPEYIAQLPAVFSANFRTSASGGYHSVRELGGKVSSYGRDVNPETLLVPVFFSLPYRSDFAPGSYAEIKLLADEGGNHVVLPAEALMEDFGVYFVYVKDEHGYERRDVKVSGNDGLRVEILSGVRPGEEVVVTGAARLKLIERLGSLGAEAAHAGHKH